MENLGHKLWYLRISHKRSQELIAKELGIELSTYAYFEENGRIPSFQVMVTLARYYGVSMDYFAFDAIPAWENEKYALPPEALRFQA